MANKQLGVDFDNKTTLSNNDTFSIADSEAGNATKDVTLGNLTAPITLDQGNARVGIGTASPSRGLHVEGSSDTTASVFVKRTGGTTGECRMGYNYVGNFDAGNVLRLYSAGTEAIRIDDSQKVGIGTNSPGSKLTLNYRNFAGDSNSAVTFDGETSDNTKSVLNLRDYGGTSILYARNDGNVGIGTTSPGSKLEVENAGTDTGLFIDQNGNGKGLSIDSEATTQRAFEITHEGTSIGAFSIYTNSVNTGTDGIFRVYADNASTTNPLVLLINDGTGPTLKANGQINFSSLPTSSAGLSAGDLWNNSGVVNIV